MVSGVHGGIVGVDDRVVEHHVGTENFTIYVRRGGEGLIFHHHVRSIGVHVSVIDVASTR